MSDHLNVSQNFFTCDTATLDSAILQNRHASGRYKTSSTLVVDGSTYTVSMTNGRLKVSRNLWSSLCHLFRGNQSAAIADKLARITDLVKTRLDANSSAVRLISNLRTAMHDNSPLLADNNLMIASQDVLRETQKLKALGPGSIGQQIAGLKIFDYTKIFPHRLHENLALAENFHDIFATTAETGRLCREQADTRLEGLHRGGGIARDLSQMFIRDHVNRGLSQVSLDGAIADIAQPKLPGNRRFAVKGEVDDTTLQDGLRRLVAHNLSPAMRNEVSGLFTLERLSEVAAQMLYLRHRATSRGEDGADLLAQTLDFARAQGMLGSAAENSATDPAAALAGDLLKIMRNVAENNAVRHLNTVAVHLGHAAGQTIVPGLRVSHEAVARAEGQSNFISPTLQGAALVADQFAPGYVPSPL